jgi:hypothetical protein
MVTVLHQGAHRCESGIGFLFPIQVFEPRMAMAYYVGWQNLLDPSGRQ